MHPARQAVEHEQAEQHHRGSLDTNTNTATTSRMPQKGTLRPSAKLLPLKNGALLTMATPAYMVSAEGAPRP